MEVKGRILGVTLEQVAAYLGWDTGSLIRYLNGTWPLSPERADALELSLKLDEPEAAAILHLPRKRR